MDVALKVEAVLKSNNKAIVKSNLEIALAADVIRKRFLFDADIQNSNFRELSEQTVRPRLHVPAVKWRVIVALRSRFAQVQERY